MPHPLPLAEREALLLRALQVARSHLVALTGGDTSVVPQKDQDFIDAVLAGRDPLSPKRSNTHLDDDGLIDPSMSDQELRLHMGEMGAAELRSARAGIGWATRMARSRLEGVRAYHETLSGIAQAKEVMHHVYEDTPALTAQEMFERAEAVLELFPLHPAPARTPEGA